MRSILLPIGVALLLAACSTGSGHDAAFWSSATCPQLNGIRFKLTFYQDSREAFTDVIYFRNDSLQSEKWNAEGFHTSMMGCGHQQLDSAIQVKAVMVNRENDWRQWNFTIVNGKPDGTLMAGENGGEAVTYTFAGAEE